VRSRHYHNVTSRLGRRQQRPNRLAQAPFDSIPDHGVAQLSAYRQADPGAAYIIIAHKEGQVGGRGAAAGAKGAVEVGRFEQALASIHSFGGSRRSGG